jgi:hypothetical protein
MGLQLKLIAVTRASRGIGPEIVAKLFARYRPAHSTAVVIGSPELFALMEAAFSLCAPVVASIDQARDMAGSKSTKAPRVLPRHRCARVRRGCEQRGRRPPRGHRDPVACELAKIGQWRPS